MILGGFSISDLFSRFKTTNKKESFYLTVCCIVKDENEYLKEWMEYHLKIGVQHFYIYDNESKISVSETLSKIGLLQFATVIMVYGKAKQVRAYNDCLIRNRNCSQWTGFIDIDEFIVPKSTNGDLKGFLKGFEQFGGLGINWLVFGSSGHLKRTNRPQLESFLLRSEESFPVNRHVKVIVQSKFVKRSIGAHLFSFKESYGAVNEKGKEITSSYSDISVEKIQINHYYCRSLEEYQDKVDRGFADTSKRKRGIEYFHNHDIEANKIEDKTILEFLNRL
jgi:hypothetical protein